MRWEREDCPPHRSRREEKESLEVTRVCVCWARGAHKSRGGGVRGARVYASMYMCTQKSKNNRGCHSSVQSTFLSYF